VEGVDGDLLDSPDGVGAERQLVTVVAVEHENIQAQAAVDAVGRGEGVAEDELVEALATGGDIVASGREVEAVVAARAVEGVVAGRAGNDRHGWLSDAWDARGIRRRR
jgi:hypothetical protein